jgi:hypothetical protein
VSATDKTETFREQAAKKNRDKKCFCSCGYD